MAADTEASILVLLIIAVYVTSRSQVDLHAVRREIDKLRFYGQNRHLCQGDTLREPDITALAGDVCYCDAFCLQFGDCCVDYSNAKKPLRNENYHCYRSGSSSRFYYVFSKCINGTLLDGCNGNVDQPSSLIHEPVFVHGILFRNEYCARCNIPESVLKTSRYKWKRRASWWPSVPPLKNVDVRGGIRKLFQERNWYYNETTRKYHLFYEKDEYTLAVDVVEFDWTNFTDVFNTSLCPPFPTVNACNDSADTSDSKLCSQYTAYVYTGSAKDIVVYRNVHCALCSGISLGQLTVGLPAPSPALESPRIIGDFLLVPELECLPGQVAVMGVVCQPVLCEVGLIWNGAQCVTDNGQVGCFILTLDVEWVRFLNSHLILWKSVERVFSDYTNITDTWGTVTHVRVCTTTPVTQPITPALERVSEVCLISSCVCLALQIVVYLALPSTRSSRSGRIIIILSSCILLGHMTFLIKDDVEPGHLSCELVAIGAHFFYISSFFWMLIMAVDSCRCLAYNMFSDPHHLLRRYVILALTGSLCVVVSGVLVGWLSPTSRFAPAYGVEVCWFGNRSGFLIFFALPTLLIISANFSLFIYTTVRIRQAQSRVGRVPTGPTTSSSNHRREMVRMKLYLRLAIIVGLTWLFGISSFVTESELGHSAFTYPFLILGFIQGVFIFIGFTCKPNIIGDLRRLVFDKKDPVSFSRSGLERRQTCLTNTTSEERKRTVPLLEVKTLTETQL
ncbi:uncharacterized protein LOC111251538 isoform X1 [Varroa destructor]|uniref:G-protein coupled receptors family 2 profile 2 domain-containing protein n=1 Tax=Varroa destructor TaxID=109461 RepID=A0A7M7KPA6_VARDE|nr:uncharacterized protein LOC111251538 isoform X1 [Varroa destructor]XP_022663933.1 uncharacterized protein LOC111251538 isoform X1 [Varroa destructor]XP_022663934.1 uncharacterized protein LOC111251538 isoform X1 [Varroa destructor]